MPEAAVDENDGLPLWQSNVRHAGERAPMKAEAKAPPVQGTPHGKFRLSVPAGDAGHDFGSALLRETVSHRRSRRSGGLSKIVVPSSAT
jgi:hypothetical protein